MKAKTPTCTSATSNNKQIIKPRINKKPCRINRQGFFVVTKILFLDELACDHMAVIVDLYEINAIVQVMNVDGSLVGIVRILR